VHSPFSTICNTKGPNGETTPNPTKSPTINLPDTPNTIETTLKFALTGLPDNVDVTKLKTNVLEALKVILARLTKRVPDLQVVGISEQVCGGRRLAQKRQLRVLERRLRDVSVCYTVEVSNSDDGTDYEALIVTEARDSYGVILDEIRTKMNYVNVGMNLVPLGGEEGSVGSNSGTLSNGSTGGSNSGTLSNGSTGNGGLPGWGIALIVILLLVLVCCIGYCIFASARTRQDDKAVNILFNNPASRTGSNHLSHYSSAPRRRSFVDTGLPSENPSIGESIILEMCAIVLLGGGMTAEEDAIDTVIITHPFLIPVAVARGAKNLGWSMMITLPYLYRIHRTQNLAKMSSQ